jgi:hypothetical protein
MELVKCLASCLGFKKLSQKFGNFTMMLQRQVKLTLAKDIGSLEQSTQRSFEMNETQKNLIRLYADKLNQLDCQTQMAARRFEKFFRKHKMPVADVSHEFGARTSML